jgi:hypothetical protein
MHGLDGIREEVEDHLLQLYSVGGDRRQTRGKFRLNRHAPSRRFAVQEMDYIRYDAVYVDWASLDRRLSKQSSDTSHDFPGFLAVTNDPLRGLVRLGHSWRIGGKPSQARMSIGDYSRERLIDFMSNRGREFTYSGRLAGPGKPRLRISQSLLHVPAFIDVKQEPVPPDHRSLAVESGLTKHLKPPKDAVMATNPALKLIHVARRKGAPPRAHDGLHIVRMKKLRPSPFRPIR